MVELIEAVYAHVECAIIINEKFPNWFRVIIGIRQGRLLSHTLISLVLEFVMADMKTYYAKS